MKKKLLGIAALLVLALPAASALAAPRGSFHGGGGFRGGRHGGGRVIIYGGGFINPYWGWYGYPGYYSGYYGYGRPYGYGYGSGYGSGYGADSNWGAVKTDVSPEEARVYLDGKYIGTADDFDGWPDKLYLRPGHYRLEFRLNGYQPLSIDVDSQPGRELKVDNKLARGNGMTNQADPPKMEGDVQRYFGKRRDRDRDRDRDRNDVRPYRRDTPGTDGYGRDRVSSDDDADGDVPAYTDGGSDHEGDTDGHADRDRNVAPPAADWRNNKGSARPDATVSARPVRGDRSRLKIKAEPVDAAVYLDDRFVGSADELASMDAGIVISPGKHTVTISRPGYRDRSAEVRVGNGATETVDLSLTR